MKTNSNLNSSILNLVNPLGCILASSPSPSNILYYQSPQIASENFKQLPIRNESENCESFNDINSSNYYPDEPETPKMPFSIENNNEQSEKLKKVDEINNSNVQNQSTNEQTKNVISKDLKIGNENKITPIIQNIVSTVELNCNLNLNEIALQLKNTYYNPKRFTGLIMRIKEPKTTALIFPNGNLVCLGAKNEEVSKKACRTFAKMIKSLNYPISNKNKMNFKIRNIVSSSNVNFKIPLMKLYIHMKKKKYRVTYEPECFPGLIYRLDAKEKIKDNNEKKLNIVFLIFSSGKMVITGAKSCNQIYDSFDEVFQLLCQFKNELNEK